MIKSLRLGVLGVFALLAIAVVAPVSAQVRCGSDANTIIDGIASESCRVISGRGEGLSRDLEGSIIRAVNLFDPNISGARQAAICLKGEGGLLRIPTNELPRQAYWAETVQGDPGFICTRVGEPSIVVLVTKRAPNQATGTGTGTTGTGTTDTGTTGTGTVGTGTTLVEDLDPEASTSTDPRFTLDNCLVVTKNILNFRAAPNRSAAVKALIPYNSVLRAIDYQDGWYNVIFGSDNGWIVAELTTPRGNCPTSVTD